MTDEPTLRRWTHALCDQCWTLREPERRPARLVARDREVCCGCGAETRSGIFIRADPSTMQFCAHRELP
jgi:hypothetical protein